MAETTQNAFLGGRLTITQPIQGYRAGVDPVLLAASVPAQKNETALDLGCGVGVAGLCLAARVSGVVVTGLELQPDYAALARANAATNGLPFEVLEGDLTAMPDAIKSRRFDHVLVNPPYFDRKASRPARDPGRETAMGEATPLALWVRTAARRAAPGGSVTFIHRTERLPDLLGEMAACLGSLELLPLAPRRGREARLCLLRGRKEGRANFRLHPPWILHAGDVHPGDMENYTDATACVLRRGAALGFDGQAL
ncbi:tRNA1(Val) (adenine(37)-N6)-methyltransferase [Roseovarius sp. C7]|uniref:tRNA1(Val) (adenine(37)-N6)-methyltransferase n=1 Tax=Roseovarius sp. C7 TaxID=3398643 RepID=UPI0039F70F59